MTAPKWYDMTAWPTNGYTMENLKDKLEPIADRYVIGFEHATTTEREHYQIRVVFKAEHEETWVRGQFPGCHTSPTKVRNFNYCEKEGNFYRSWEKGLNKFAGIQLRKWQGMAISAMLETDDRQIMVVYDPVGGIGKTTLARYMVINRIATYVPPMSDAQDFMAFAMAKPSKAYIFDMPRSESVKQKKGMWSAVEQIKNGYLYDKRYSFRDMWIEPPKIIIICNELPDMDSLSADRWKFYRVSNDGLYEDDPELERFYYEG